MNSTDSSIDEIPLPYAANTPPTYSRTNRLRFLARLQREGRLGEFEILKASLMSAPKSFPELVAFRVAAAEFPAVDRLTRKKVYSSRRTADPTIEESAFDVTRGEEVLKTLLKKSGAVNFDRDWEWAYAHMGVPGIALANAPSVPAFEVLKYAQANQEIFLRMFMAWSEKRRKDQLGQDAFQDDRRQKFSLLDKLDAALQHDSATRLRELVLSHPDLIVSTLQGLGWQCERPRPKPKSDRLSPDAEVRESVAGSDHLGSEIAPVGQGDVREPTTELV